MTERRRIDRKRAGRKYPATLFASAKSISGRIKEERRKMKTKTKIVALLEIGVVLSGVLFLAAPVFAAEQNAEASQAAATAAAGSGDGYVLGIYGNANEDDTIDMRDITYAARIILWLEEETELADANNDGRVSVADMTQIGLIILGKESELTIVDSADRIVTVKMPVERLIPTDYRATEAELAIGARDLIVGVDRAFHERMAEFGLEDLPEVSEHSKFVDYEAVLVLEPDLVVLPTWQAGSADDVAEHLPGIPVIVMGCTKKETIVPDLKTMGMLLGKRDEAGALIEWTQKYDGIVEERTEDLEPEEMPTFYYEYMSGSKKWWAITPEDSSAGQVAEGCGGRNIAAGQPGSKVEVQAEWVIKQNPDVMFCDLMKGFESGPGKTEEEMQELLEEILADRPGFEAVEAVKKNKVYLIDRDLISGPRWVIGHCYFAKWLHPELFSDIHPEEMHDEYLSEFHDLELEGTWAYPLPQE